MAAVKRLFGFGAAMLLALNTITLVSARLEPPYAQAALAHNHDHDHNHEHNSEDAPYWHQTAQPDQQRLMRPPLPHPLPWGSSSASSSLKKNKTAPIPAATRAFWMRYALALIPTLSGSACPLAPFVALVVNHSDTSSSPYGTLICQGINAVYERANPTLHGEMVAINACADVLQGPKYNLSSTAALAAFQNLSLYTTAEPCPMCAGAIRWAGFGECIYGTGMFTLLEAGWQQMIVSAKEIFTRGSGFGVKINLVPDVVSNETDPYFAWQFDPLGACPTGCTKGADGVCSPD